MGRVVPHIVEPLAPARDVGNVVRPVEDRGERIPVSLEARAAEAAERGRVLRLNPSERAGAVHLFKPEPWVVIRGEGSGAGIGWGHAGSLSDA